MHNAHIHTTEGSKLELEISNLLRDSFFSAWKITSYNVIFFSLSLSLVLSYFLLVLMLYIYSISIPRGSFPFYLLYVQGKKKVCEASSLYFGSRGLKLCWCIVYTIFCHIPLCWGLFGGITSLLCEPLFGWDPLQLRSRWKKGLCRLTNEEGRILKSLRVNLSFFFLLTLLLPSLSLSLSLSLLLQEV